MRSEYESTIKKLFFQYEDIRPYLTYHFTSSNQFVAGLLEQVRHFFDHIARCYTLYQIFGSDPNNRKIEENLTTAKNHLDRLNLDIMKSLMYYAEDDFNDFVSTVDCPNEHNKELTEFLTKCSEIKEWISQRIYEARKMECEEKNTVGGKPQYYKKAWEDICKETDKLKKECPVSVGSQSIVLSPSGVNQQQSGVNQQICTPREIYEFYWKELKNAISWREIKKKEFDPYGLLLLVDAIDYLAWHYVNGTEDGLVDAKKQLQKLKDRIDKLQMKN